MDEILNEINFDAGIAMPVANAANKKIEIEVSCSHFLKGRDVVGE